MKWIEFKDQKPTEEGLHLILASSADPKKPYRNIAWWTLGKEEWSLLPQVWIDAITHWMSLPKSPGAQNES